MTSGSPISSPYFTSQACGIKGAKVRGDFNWERAIKSPILIRGRRSMGLGRKTRAATSGAWAD
jgi:hypothetical protein